MEQPIRIEPVNARFFFATADRIVKCRQCGECCRNFSTVYIKKQEIKRLAHHLKISTSKLKKRYKMVHDSPQMWRLPANPCPFLKDEAHCTIYELRPNRCRAFPFISMMYTALSKKTVKKAIEFQRECPKSMALLDIITRPRVTELLALTSKFTKEQCDELIVIMESYEENVN